MTKILITGGTGQIGKLLCEKLQEKGYDVAILSRKKTESSVKSYTWDINNNEIEKGAIESADYIIHLAGANIGDKRWTPERKKLILSSRIKTGQLLLSKIQEQTEFPKAFISASAIGYYSAITTDKTLSETAPASKDFLGNTCQKWEKIADKFNDLGIRTVKIRTGIVLSNQGGVLSKMVPLFKFGIGSAIGSGKQYFPWIHINDLCEIYIKAIEDSEMAGAYNAVVADRMTNKEFSRTLARVLNKPFWFPNVPTFLVKLIFGEMSVMLLKGSKISADKIIKTRYNFLFPELEIALTNLIKK
jgi:uncharacterized protein